jgi:hypothetical protein
VVAASLPALVLGEGIVRVVAPQRGVFTEPPLYLNDDTLGYRHRPGYAGQITNIVEYTTQVTINTMGLRGPEVRAASEPRVLLLGDSFVFGQGVEQVETLSARLEARLGQARPVQVLNAGVSGYGPVQESLWFAELGAALQPAIVVAMFAVLIPDAMQVIGTRQREFARLQRVYAQWSLDLTHPNKVFTTLLADRGVPVLDLTPSLEAAAAQGRTLSWPRDGHWNAAGHDLAAEVLASHLAPYLTRMSGVPAK